MTIAAGAKLGACEVVAQIGASGLGEVYPVAQASVCGISQDHAGSINSEVEGSFLRTC